MNRINRPSGQYSGEIKGESERVLYQSSNFYKLYQSGGSKDGILTN